MNVMADRNRLRLNVQLRLQAWQQFAHVVIEVFEGDCQLGRRLLRPGPVAMICIITEHGQ